MADMDLLRVQELTKIYRSGDRELTVLDHVSFSIAPTSSCSVVGPSGCGKTTLLSLCAGLDHPSSGSVWLNGNEIGSLTEDERSAIRSRYSGFVFQTFQLIPTLTALENVMVPAELTGNPDARSAALDLLEQTGLADRAHHYPVQLSGGEQQRIALARAFINRPKILFCDEPTGNLDDESGDKITELIFEMNRIHNTTLIIVTHDTDLARRSDRILKLKNGRIVADNPVNISEI